MLLDNAIDSKRTLIISPASLRLNWEREIWQWSTLENVSTYPVLKSSDGISSQADFNIISYDLLRNKSIMQAVLDLRWDHVILDEAHKLKDTKGNKTTKAICAPDMLPSVVGRITLATGTLLPNQPSECYNAIRLCNWDAIDRASLEDFMDFYYDYGSGMVRSPVWDEALQANVSKLHFSDKVRNVPRNEMDLQWRLRKHLMVRRLKEEVLSELPPITWHPFPMAITAGIRRALSHPGWVAAQKLYNLDATSFDGGIPIDGEISTARRELGEAKAEAIADYAIDLLESGVRKLVIGAWHHSVLDILRNALQEYGLVYMDGKTSSAKKQQAVDSFQLKDEIRIMLGQTEVLGQGWTLTAAQDVLNAEPDWVPGKNEQLGDRICRLGQGAGNLMMHIPVVPGTLDERLLSVAIEKAEHIYNSLDRRY